MIRLYHADCRQDWPTIRGPFAIVSDPPYGIAYVHGAGGGKRPDLTYRRPVRGDDRPFDPEHLLQRGACDVLLWGADHYIRRLPDRGRLHAWDKREGRAMRDSFSDVEFVWQQRATSSRGFAYFWKGLCRRRAPIDGRRRSHVMQKPVALMRWCIGLAKGKPITIVDPYMGTGVTALAARELGLNFVGFEIDRTYFDRAVRRLEAPA